MSTVPKSSAPVLGGGAVVDNRTRTVGDFLRARLGADAVLSVVSAYFTIYAYGDLRQELERLRRLRFLYGQPAGAGAVDPAEGEDKAFRLTRDGAMELRNALTQKPLARACSKWIADKVDVRTVRKANFLHGKLYHTEGADGDTAALMGSSNFTRGGLGFGANPNIELNLEVRDDADRARLLRWFDDLWRDEQLTRDAKDEVLAALARLGKDYSPEFVYYKTLFHILRDRIDERGQRDGLIQDVHLHDTEIWKALYRFQKDGAVSAINRLLNHNGCIVADSVGLGKTWTALAVVKFFEMRNERVLVLCPKKLKENWVRYTSWAGYGANPLEKDRFGYTVLAHTDLSRYKGMAGAIDLAKFNWGAFDLVVIDESHNFRNQGRDRKDDNGRVVRRSRYNRLMEEALKGGVHTKVLMLSATPVNTGLRDLRNQIYLMTEKRQDVFREGLGIGNIQSLFGVAQSEFQKWENRCQTTGRRDKGELLERLGADFLALLDAVSIARSRDHVRRFYPEVETQIGGFPKRAKPINLHPATDSEGELSYDALYGRISRFRLAVYMPSQYLRDTSALEEEKERLHFDQRDREHWLIGMMRINLLKRLESSVHSFTLTMGRIIEKMDLLDERIDAWIKQPGNQQIDLLGQAVESDEEEEDEEFTLGRGRRYRLADLDLIAWREDLQADRRSFAAIYEQAARVGMERDAKLLELKRLLSRKVKEAPVDKDGRPNRKALVFTSFSDTASYLYSNLAEWARAELGVHVGLVTGGGGNRATTGPADFTGILAHFAPVAQLSPRPLEEIDILIATDCLSEGQNLQDCGFVVNYDVHWNPVRLMQRFGRVDRIGSRNQQVVMANFWPTRDLDRYLDLKNRVEARMALADAAATGTDDPLAVGNSDDAKQAVQQELSFRDQQLRRLREESLDLEEVEDGISMSDFTLDDFLVDLLNYLQENREALESAPLGIQAVVPPAPFRDAGYSQDSAGESSPASRNPASAAPTSARPGTIFCLKQRDGDRKTPNRLQPYFLAYVHQDGTVRYTFKQAKQVLTLFSALARGRTETLTELVNAFDRETRHGQNMAKYNLLIRAGLRSVANAYRQAEVGSFLGTRDGSLTTRTRRPASVSDFELVTWLVIMEAPDRE